MKFCITLKRQTGKSQFQVFNLFRLFSFLATYNYYMYVYYSINNIISEKGRKNYNKIIEVT